MNSNTRYNLPFLQKNNKFLNATYLLKASIILTTDLSLRTLNILTSLFVVFFTI